MDKPIIQAGKNDIQPDGELLSVVNVSEINKPTAAKITYPEDNLWYNRLSTWVLVSMVLSLLCLAMAYFYRRFLFIIPLWPMVAVISWYLKRKFRQFEDKNSGFFK